MTSSTTEGLDLGSMSSRGSPTSEALDSITSATTFDLFSDLQDSTESSEDLTLPKSPSFIASTVNKKRDRDEYLASSSDAPFFSSDDLPASSADNYYGPRLKRQHRRPWYDEPDESWNSVTVSSLHKKPRMRGPFKRTDDSGVWLDSDESTESEDNDRQDAVRRALRVMESGGSIDGDEDIWHKGGKEPDLEDKIHESTQTLEEKLQQALVNKALQIIEDPGGFEGPVFPYWQKQPGHLTGFHLVQEQAQKVVALCVEQGGEAVDLSYVAFSRIHSPQRLAPRCSSSFLNKSGLTSVPDQCICSKYERRRYGRCVTIQE